MIDLIAGIAAGKNGLDIIKGTIELLRLRDVRREEISEQVNSVHRVISDMLSALDQAKEEKAELEGRISELTKWADFGKELKLSDGIYWREGAAYCPICWEQDHKPTRLSGPWRLPQELYKMEHWNCSLHNSEFQTQGR